MAAGTKGTVKKDIRKKFIDAIREHRSITKACEAVGKGRTTVYRWRKDNQEFQEEWDEAVETNVDDLEAGAMRRAIEGWLEPVYYKGEPKGVIRKFSNALTIFMLKKQRPKIYEDVIFDRTDYGEMVKDETFL